MVATVGSIAIDLAVRSAAFEAGFRKAGTTVERESTRMQRATAGVDRAMATLSRSAAGLAGAFGGALAGREIVRYADAWTLAGNKIKAAGEIAGREGRNLREINDIATRSRSGLTETADLYSKLLISTGDLAKNELEVAKATEIVAKAFKVGGAAAEQQAAGILQLGQAFSSGKFAGDELKSVAENATVLAQIIANEFGVQIGQLSDLGARGELEVGRVFKAILKAEGDIEKAFAGTQATIAEGFTRVRNAGIELIGTLSEITGGAGSLAGELNRFGEGIEQMSDAIAKFANDPSVRSFFADLAGGAIREGSLADKIRDSFDRTREEVVADIDAVKAKIVDLEATAAAFGGMDFDLLNLEREREELARLTDELAGLDRTAKAAGNNGGGAIDSLVKSAESALTKVDEVASSVASLKDKTVTINVRTVYDTPDGPIGVTRGYAGPGGMIQPAYTGDFLGGDDSFLGGGSATPSTSITPPASINRYAAGGSPSAGEIAMVGEEGPELVRFGAAATVSSASSTANILSGGASVLSMIEENTFQAVEEIRRVVGYLDTMENDGQTAIAALRAIKDAIGGSQINVGSSGGSFSSGGSSGGMGGFGGGGGVENPYRYVGGVFYPGSGGFDWRNYNAFQGGFQQQRTGLDGFATGGMIHPGDTQEVSFFKNPDEAVGIFRPEQMDAIGAAMSSGSNVAVHYHAAPGNPNPSQRAMMELQDRVRQTIRDVQGGL